MYDEPDVEYAAKQWAQADALLSPLLAGRVFFAFPAGAATLPLLTVAIVSGTFDPAVPVAYPRLTFDCWGRTKKEASDLRRALTTALRDLDNVAMTADVYCYGVDDIFIAWQPDNEAKLARYVVDATFKVRNLAAV